MDEEIPEPGTTSFLLIDEQEQIVVDDHEGFAHHLCCQKDTRLKVVSIFGNTGDGKSHTLNHVFFNGREVFRTSPEQRSCTVGVWAAYAPHHRALVIDTEGLLGLSQNENRRIRLLLKTLAISDIVLYRTRAERLHNDMFLFLDDASNAYWKYFSPELETVSQNSGFSHYSVSSLGPSVVIFHETQFTEILHVPDGSNVSYSDDDLLEEAQVDMGKLEEVVSADEHIQKRFAELKLSPKAFSAIEYVGTQTLTPPTNFVPLKKRISEMLRNNSVRSPRTLSVIYKSLQTLNENFMNDISGNRPPLFPDFYFSCQKCCVACGVRCDLSTNHTKHGKPHTSNTKCKYLHKLDNRTMLCKKCLDQGIMQEVSSQSWSENDSSWFGIARYAWSGYIIECPSCGIIYQSRQHWYGNSPPEHGSIVTENKHVWNDKLEVGTGTGDTNRYRQAIDLVHTVGESITQATSSTQQLLADKVAPDYWVPNADIKCCCVCSCDLTGLMKTKHHCRACGEGVCARCSTHSIPVPWRGWGDTPVRVCDHCCNSKGDTTLIINSSNSEEATVSSRYITENLTSAVGWVGSILEYPKQAVVESARPSYWLPDSQIINCCVCQMEFAVTGSDIHHCRSCGQGVCDDCSQKRQPVPHRGWDYPVRICDNCANT